MQLRISFAFDLNVRTLPAAYDVPWPCGLVHRTLVLMLSRLDVGSSLAATVVLASLRQDTLL